MSEILLGVAEMGPMQLSGSLYDTATTVLAKNYKGAHLKVHVVLSITGESIGFLTLIVTIGRWSFRMLSTIYSKSLQ